MTWRLLIVLPLLWAFSQDPVIAPPGLMLTELERVRTYAEDIKHSRDTLEVTASDLRAALIKAQKELDAAQKEISGLKADVKNLTEALQQKEKSSKEKKP